MRLSQIILVVTRILKNVSTSFCWEINFWHSFIQIKVLLLKIVWISTEIPPKWAKKFVFFYRSALKYVKILNGFFANISSTLVHKFPFPFISHIWISLIFELKCCKCSKNIFLFLMAIRSYLKFIASWNKKVYCVKFIGSLSPCHLKKSLNKKNPLYSILKKPFQYCLAPS